LLVELAVGHWLRNHAQTEKRLVDWYLFLGSNLWQDKLLTSFGDQSLRNGGGSWLWKGGSWLWKGYSWLWKSWTLRI
jgi:hypothetical protein